jgi:hypothetical protein
MDHRKWESKEEDLGTNDTTNIPMPVEEPQPMIRTYPRSRGFRVKSCSTFHDLFSVGPIFLREQRNIYK